MNAFKGTKNDRTPGEDDLVIESITGVPKAYCV